MKTDIVVLGIHDGHNAGAALIKNGSVLAAIQKERLNNLKNFSGVPIRAIQKVFEISKIHPYELKIIVIAGLINTHLSLKEQPMHVQLYERYGRIIQNYQ